MNKITPVASKSTIKTKPLARAEPVKVEQVDHVIIDSLPAYVGNYTITPSDKAIILKTENKAMSHDVKIEPIPKNYGLVTWDGFKMTIS